MRNESYSEQEQISRARRGDQGAMKAIYLLYARYLTAVCSRYVVNSEDVADVLQDSFVSIFSNLDKFEYREGSSLKSWMTRIVVNQSLKFLRDNKRMQFVESVDEYRDVADETIEPDGVPYEEMRKLICELPAGYRTVFNLYVFERKSHKEIAAMLGIKTDTSASQFHKAKKMLAVRLEQYKKGVAR